MIFSDTIKATVKDAAQKLTGYRKRDFMAKVAEDYLGACEKIRYQSIRNNGYIPFR